MKHRKCCGLGLFLFLTWSAVVWAQAPTTPAPTNNPAETQLLRAILSELRQLRLTLQRVIINSQRAQTLAMKVSGQESAVRWTTSDLEQERHKLAEAESTLKQFEDEHKQPLEMARNAAASTEERTRLTEQIELFTMQKKQAEQESRTRREAILKLEAKLQQEQLHLAELQEELNALNRELDAAIKDGA